MIVAAHAVMNTLCPPRWISNALAGINSSCKAIHVDLDILTLEARVLGAHKETTFFIFTLSLRLSSPSSQLLLHGMALPQGGGALVSLLMADRVGRTKERSVA
jgi:hypothetical protein